MCEIPLSTSSTFTVAPGMIAPDESVTTPRISPEFVFCATAARAGHNMARPRLARIHCFILPPGEVPSAALNPIVLLVRASDRSLCFVLRPQGLATIWLGQGWRESTASYCLLEKYHLLR